MTHLLVVDYPYYTTRKLFESLDEVENSNPDKRDLLSARVYPITNYTNENRYTIDINEIIDYTLTFKRK